MDCNTQNARILGRRQSVVSSMYYPGVLKMVQE